jgi:hypothetical protein
VPQLGAIVGFHKAMAEPTPLGDPRSMVCSSQILFWFYIKGRRAEIYRRRLPKLALPQFV